MRHFDTPFPVNSAKKMTVRHLFPRGMKADKCGCLPVFLNWLTNFVWFAFKTTQQLQQSKNQ
jgi:hypothetical protein